MKKSARNTSHRTFLNTLIGRLPRADACDTTGLVRFKVTITRREREYWDVQTLLEDRQHERTIMKEAFVNSHFEGLDNDKRYSWSGYSTPEKVLLMSLKYGFSYERI